MHGVVYQRTAVTSEWKVFNDVTCSLSIVIDDTPAPTGFIDYALLSTCQKKKHAIVERKPNVLLRLFKDLVPILFNTTSSVHGHSWRLQHCGAIIQPKQYNPSDMKACCDKSKNNSMLSKTAKVDIVVYTKS